jgi:hypothetical protein
MLDKAPKEPVCFRERDFKGSRFRCLLLTHQPRAKVSAFLNSLVQPFATVNEKDKFMPEGFVLAGEAMLGETPGFLSSEHDRVLKQWWLASLERARTPNWDLISTCTVEDRRGLVLVEAKAHIGELKRDDSCKSGNSDNLKQISDALAAANLELGQGWGLSPNSCYQLSNRFAWAWKLASLGVPVLLVYLGFLNAHEMPTQLPTHQAWEKAVLAYAEGIVPKNVWGNRLVASGGSPIIPLIRSADINLSLP